MRNWDLIRYFLAVARRGSTLAAAQELKQSQPTVARRIEELERGLGVRLFDRRKRGYRLTPAGEALVIEAQAVEAAAMRFIEQGGAQSRTISGTIRFTTFDMFANVPLARLLQEFGRLYPDVKVEVVVTEQVLDLASGEADVALRGGKRPMSGELVCRKVGETSWTAYCSRVYAEAHGHPHSVEELAGHALIGGEGMLADLPAMRWLVGVAPLSPIKYRSNTVQNLVASVKAGLGISVLPCAFFSSDDDLLPCVMPPPADLTSEAWLLTHERLRNEPHVRAFTDFIADFMMRRSTAKH